MISESQIKIYEFARRASRWFTAREVARKTGINPRTVRWHLLRLTQIRVLERHTVFGGCRYRLVIHPDDRAIDHVRQIEAVEESFQARQSRIAKFAALFTKQPKRTEIAKRLPPDEARATLAYELAEIGRLTRARRADYFNRVLEDLDSAWQHQEQHLKCA